MVHNSSMIDRKSDVLLVRTACGKTTLEHELPLRAKKSYSHSFTLLFSTAGSLPST